MNIKIILPLNDYYLIHSHLTTFVGGEYSVVLQMLKLEDQDFLGEATCVLAEVCGLGSVGVLENT